MACWSSMTTSGCSLVQCRMRSLIWPLDGQWTDRQRTEVDNRPTHNLTTAPTQKKLTVCNLLHVIINTSMEICFTILLLYFIATPYVAMISPLPHRTASEHIGPHWTASDPYRTASDHIGSELSTWTSKCPHMTHRDSFAPQKCPRFDHTYTQSIFTLRPNRLTRRAFLGNWH